MPTTLEAVKVALSVAEVGVGVISQLLSHMVRRFFQIDGDAVPKVFQDSSMALTLDCLQAGRPRIPKLLVLMEEQISWSKCRMVEADRQSLRVRGGLTLSLQLDLPAKSSQFGLTRPS